MAQKKGAGEEAVGIEELLGLAMGCIGMNLDDFRRCTPAEFSVIYRFGCNMMNEMYRMIGSRHAFWLAVCYNLIVKRN